MKYRFLIYKFQLLKFLGKFIPYFKHMIEFTEEDIPKVEYTFSKEEVYKGIKCICHYVVLKVSKKGKKVTCECGFLGFTRL